MVLMGFNFWKSCPTEYPTLAAEYPISLGIVEAHYSANESYHTERETNAGSALKVDFFGYDSGPFQNNRSQSTMVASCVAAIITNCSIASVLSFVVPNRQL